MLQRTGIDLASFSGDKHLTFGVINGIRVPDVLKEAKIVREFVAADKKSIKRGNEVNTLRNSYAEIFLASSLRFPKNICDDTWCSARARCLLS